MERVDLYFWDAEVEDSQCVCIKTGYGIDETQFAEELRTDSCMKYGVVPLELGGEMPFEHLTDIMRFHQFAPVVSARAADVIRAALYTGVDWIQATLCGQSCYIVHVRNMYINLEMNKSQVEYLSGGRVWYVENLCVKRVNTKRGLISRIREYPESPPIVNGEFVDLWQKADLTGAQFQSVPVI